ncbi:hypothetical protein FVQ98_05940 [Ottowia sp. GY511]|uniref:ABC-three component system middle component 5 n=2 Tax=Ottowia flava TaxID=2675430 RepID=A0ABW4KYN1_9BURK|nr:ABC-three component system middle component 5 [Ottowia sp. GY511]TXK31501.1 hypothetical protein FVQ98_05940 [Ottowia sp. GY511]
MLVATNTLSELELAKLRILDYYLSFPAEVAHIQLPREYMRIKKVASSIKNEYRGPVNGRMAFRDMELIQNSAARLLAASEVFDPKRLESGIVLRTSKNLPDTLSELKSNSPGSNEAHTEVLNFILDKLGKMQLTGPGGIKQRTGLMEHRYDVI